MDIRKALMDAMEAYFGADAKRINHARRVTGYAERLMEKENGDRAIVLGAAVLHDIGIHQAEWKHGSSSGKYQEIEGPPIARDILVKLWFQPAQVDEICDIVAHHHSPGKVNTPSFKIVYDADWLVNLKDEYDIQDKKKLATIISRVFLTETGKAVAREVYLANP